MGAKELGDVAIIGASFAVGSSNLPISQTTVEAN